MPEKFDFSKIEDREKFENLPKKEKDEVIGESQEEADWIKNEAKRWAGNSNPKKGDYEKAENELEKGKKGLLRFICEKCWSNMVLSKRYLPEKINQQVASEAIIKLMADGIRRDNYDYIFSIKKEFKLSDEIFSSPKFQEAAKQGCIDCLSTEYVGYIDYAIKIKDEFNLPEEMIQPIVVQELIKRLSEGYIDDVIKIKFGFNLPEAILKSPEIQEVAKQGLIKCLSKGYIDDAIKIKFGFNLPEAILKSSEVQEAAKQGFIKLFQEGNIDNAAEILEEFNVSHEIIKIPEVQEAAKKGFTICLSRGDMSDALDILREFNLPKTIINISEVQGYAKKGFAGSLLKGNYSEAEKAKNTFNFSEIFIQETSKQEIIRRLLEGDIVGARNIIDHLNLLEMLNDMEIQEAAGQEFADNLYLGHADVAAKIKKDFNLSTTFTQEAAKKVFIKFLTERFIDSAINIKDKLSFSISPQEIIQQIPELNKLIEKISQFAPEFQAQVEKSSELAIELCRFLDNPDQMVDTLKENPFLIDAITSNSRFSSRLLIKYHEFDEVSQENIEKLFSVKKKLIEKNPEMDSESLEFRQLMQEELKKFKNNPEIMEAIEKQGIDLDEWLNYSETEYFNLSTGGAEIAFSEKIRTPIDRIKETIDSYAHTLKSVLKEYRPEMEKFEIVLENAGPIDEQIAKMELALKKYRNEGDEKSAQGIEKGLASQKEKLNNLKKGFLWNKIIGEIASFQLLKNDCFDAQNRLMEAENKLNEALSGKMPSGKMIQDIKKAIASSKEELRSKFSNLESRIENFKAHLWTTISPCLGDDRTGALMQEIQTKLAEQFDHYDSDRTTLANMFSERSDKETEQLESRPMSIFVWARNPDIDLYQGNYSPCCICIDSAHMGAESTIADYNTDLGIQIVNIWDETKNEPVTAAWCWLGQDEKGEKALVVDNIESNTLFSSNFSEQLSDELFKYLENYAKKIGVEKIVLGKANNDLPTASRLANLKDDNSRYEKIGGSNRSDGYFLEAENKSVKILWENSEPIEKVKKEAEKVSKVEFKDFKIESVSKENLEKILQAERKIYAGTELISGQTMVEDMKRGNGFEYSVAMLGVRPGKKQAEIVSYIVAVEDETDEGDKSIYLEDIAVLPEAQRQGIGWETMKEFVGKLKMKAEKDGKPILLDMHLREGSRALLQRHKEELENMGVRLIEEALVPDYYDEGEDALYQVYEVK
jgi:ribosomal protein S18 acetylase RimI-like enzyme